MVQIKNKVKNLKVTDVETFLSWEFNTLKDPKRDVTKLKKAILQGGFSFPVIVWQKFVIDGAGRRKAVEELMKEGHLFPAIPYVEIEAKNLKEAKQKALEVSSQFGHITKESFLSFTEGLELDFGSFELAGIREDMFVAAKEKQDNVPELPKKAKSKQGDVYVLGNHRVMCGDSVSEKDVALLMGSSRAELLFTSPPYSDMREYNGGKDLSIGYLSKFISVFSKHSNYQAVNLGIQRKKSEVYEYWQEYIKEAKECGYKLLSWNVWVQDGAGSIGKQTAMFPIQHEWIFVFGKEPKEINRTEERSQPIKTRQSTHRNKDGSVSAHPVGRQENHKALGTVLFANAEKGFIRSEHPATYPVELPQKYVLCMTKYDDVVSDPFGGSGSTLIACEQTGRKCFMMELDPKYVDVIVQRYVDYTGNENIIKNGKPLLWQKRNK